MLAFLHYHLWPSLSSTVAHCCHRAGTCSGLAFCKYTANYVDSESILTDFPPTVILNTHNNTQVRKYA